MMNGTHMLVGAMGLSSLSILVSCLGIYNKKASNEIAIKELEIKHEAIAVEAWDKLSIRAVLKKKDKDLSTYFLEEQKYLSTLNMYRNTVTDMNGANNESLHQVLIMLRMSPFFNEQCIKEYNDLQKALAATGSTGPTGPAGINKLKVGLEVCLNSKW